MASPVQTTPELSEAKVSYGDEIRMVKYSSARIASLADVCGNIFKLDPLHVVLKYEDTDKDKITMSSDEELQKALAFSGGKPLRVFVFAGQDMLGSPQRQSRPKETSLTPGTKAKVDGLELKIEQMLIKMNLTENSGTPGTITEWYTEQEKPPETFWFAGKNHANIFQEPNCILDSAVMEDVVQSKWDGIATELRKATQLTVHLYSSPTAATIGSCKPDFPGYAAGQTRSIYCLVVVGDVKRGRSADVFSSEEKGQMGSFLAKLLKLTNRPFCFGFLTDGRIIQFFKMTMDNGNFIFSETSVEYLAINGGYYLLELLSQPMPVLGLTNVLDLKINEEKVDIVGYLGHGGFSVVYKGKVGKKEVVVKYFSPDKHAFVSVEEQILCVIRDLAPSVPLVLGYADKHIQIPDYNPVVLVLDTVGLPFVGHNAAKLTSSHICDLVDVLELAHRKELAHRDIKLQNFFYRTENKVLLNDWSCAANFRSQVPILGSLSTMPSHLLAEANNQNYRYNPKASDDLESVVKMFYLFLFPRECPTKVYDIKEFWQSVFQLVYWKRLQRMAENLDYSGLKQEISGIRVAK